jgi:hypothetical protein
MGFLGLFDKKKEPVRSSSGLGAGVNVPRSSIPSPKPIPSPPQATGKPPEDLPKFPVDMQNTQNIQKPQPKEQKTFFNVNQEKKLPRLESEHAVKDFVSSGKKSLPGFEHIEPYEEKSTSFEKVEDDFKKTEPFFNQDIKAIERPESFDLHDEIRRPLFIRTDQFKEVKENMLELHDALEESDEIYYRMNNLNSEQDSQYDLFHDKIEEIQRKLIYVDKTIFEKGD